MHMKKRPLARKMMPPVVDVIPNPKFIEDEEEEVETEEEDESDRNSANDPETEVGEEPSEAVALQGEFIHLID